MLHVKHLHRSFSCVLAVVFFCTTATAALSQSYWHSPNDTVVANTTVDNSVTMNITQVNPNGDTLQFVWRRLFVSLPNDWTAQICDNAGCYASLIDSSATLPVLPGDDGLMLIHCYPNNNPGIGTIQYTIYEIHSPLQIDTLTWIVNAQSTADVNDPLAELSAYTLNGNHFQLKENSSQIKNIALFDNSGKEVFSSEVSQSTVVELPLLSPSYYFLVLSGTNILIREKIWYSLN